MRKRIAALLIAALILSLSACGGSLKEPVSFYYLRRPDAIVYGTEDGLIAPEQREASGHVEDLEYLLTLYLCGPLDSHLVSPVPEGVRLEGLLRRKNHLTVILSQQFSELSGVELTAACVCISATCFELTDAEKVTIISRETARSEGVSITLTRESVTFLDDSMPAADTSEPLS